MLIRKKHFAPRVGFSHLLRDSPSQTERRAKLSAVALENVLSRVFSFSLFLTLSKITLKLSMPLLECEISKTVQRGNSPVRGVIIIIIIIMTNITL